MSHWISSLTAFETMAPLAVYAVLFTFVYVETGIPVGFFLPGDSVLFAAGLLAAHPGSQLSLPVLAVGVFVAAVAGDGTGYALGHRMGRPWLLRRAGRASAQVHRAERLYARYGWGAVVISRFIPWVRTFVPVVAGIGVMPYRRFVSANLVGAGVWGVMLVVLGYFAYALPGVKWAAYAIALVAIAWCVVVPLRDRRRDRRAAAAGGAPGHSSEATSNA